MVTDEEMNQGNRLHEDKWSIGLNVFHFVWEYLIFLLPKITAVSEQLGRREVFQYS